MDQIIIPQIQEISAEAGTEICEIILVCGPKLGVMLGHASIG